MKEKNLLNVESQVVGLDECSNLKENKTSKTESEKNANLKENETQKVEMKQHSEFVEEKTPVAETEKKADLREAKTQVAKSEENAESTEVEIHKTEKGKGLELSEKETHKTATKKSSDSKENENFRKPLKKKLKAKTIAVLVLLFVVLSLGLVMLFFGTEGIKNLGNFLSSQVLGMSWLNLLIGMMFTSLLGEPFMATLWGSSLQFFIYDTMKIFILLCVLIFAISYVQSYFPPERTKKLLGRVKGLKANIMGALLGTVTPFCSCSSIPLFMGFTRGGISSGVTFSFLISSPLVDLGALILLSSVFGFPIAIAYVVVGLVLAVLGGSIIEKTGVGKHIQPFILEGSMKEIDAITPSKRERLIYSKEQVFATIKKVWIYILVGVGIGAAIHNFIPQAWIEAVLGSDKWYSVLVATAVGTPMYADIFGTIPVAQALFSKGVGVGTILSFMMSVTALSLPSLIMLSKAVKPKLLFWFVAIVVVGIILMGYTFNAFNFLFI